MTTIDETATRAAGPRLHSRSGYATWTANAFVDRNGGIPYVISTEGNAMTVDAVHVEWQQDVHVGDLWMLSRIEIEGVYVHDAKGPAPVLTAMTQKASFHPDGARPEWLAAVLDELRPPGPPPGHDLDDTHRAALALADVPADALQMLVRSSGVYGSVLDEIGEAAAGSRALLTQARDALLNVWREVRRDERFARTAARQDARKAAALVKAEDVDG